MAEKAVLEGGVKDLSALLGITERSVQNFASKGVFKRVRRGVYDLRESVRVFYQEQAREASQYEEDKGIDKNSVSSSELSDLLGISSRWIQKLTAEGILKKNGERYDLVDAVQSYCEYLRGSSKSNQGELDAETLRLTRAKADKAEIAVEMLLGSTVQVDAVSQIWADLVTIFRSKMLGLPNKLAATLALKDDPAEIQSLVMEEVRDSLEDIARFNPEDVIERALPGDIEDDTSTSEPDCVGVGG